MKEEARLTFYKIEQCGYYSRGSDWPVFGNVADTFEQLRSYLSADGMTLLGTAMGKPSDNGAVALRTCCYAVEMANTGDFLIVLWNETPTVDGKVPAIRLDGLVGQAEVEFSDVKDGYMAGYPTYFWVVPEKSAFATICFQTPLNGQHQFARYVENYLAKWTRYVVASTNGDTHEIIGYRANANEEPSRQYPRFRTALYPKSGDLQYIRQNVGRIRKTVRRDFICANVKESVSWWQAILDSLGVSQKPQPPEDVRIEYSANLFLSADELDSIINSWQQHHTEQWDDVGFLFQDEQAPRWLSHSFAKDRASLDVERQNAAIVAPSSLLNALVAHRNGFLALLK